jgi:molybdopterin-synthase adenylyltransferase
MSSRHSRHRLFPGIGDSGQETLARSRVAVVGCGALGSRIAELLGRAGVATAPEGLLRLIDRDYVEASNLQRQALFDDADAEAAAPKAPAARGHLLAIDPSIRCEAFVRDLSPSNALQLLSGVDLILDGTDNFRTRFLVNDVSIRIGTPWIYGGAVASRGAVAAFRPLDGPCFRCFLESMPALGIGDTCETAGVITPLPSLVASLQVALAMRFLVSGQLPRGLRLFDLWDSPFEARTVFERTAASPGCRSCGSRELPSLSDDSQEVVTLCGRNSVQVSRNEHFDLDAAEARLRTAGSNLRRHPQSLTLRVAEGSLTCFADGRIIVEGTTDPAEATSLISRYLGD